MLIWSRCLRIMIIDAPKKICSNRKGLTLIELLVSVSILSVLVFTIGYSFVIGLKLWNEGYNRSDIRTDLSQALELVTKNLRQATSIDTITQSSITFTADLDRKSVV